VVDEDAAHLRGGDGEEVLAIVECRRIIRAKESEICFVHQAGCLQRMVDTLTSEVEKPFLRGAAIDDACDVDVVELAENAALLLEALNQPVGAELGPDDFDGADSLVHLVGADGLVDDAHSAAAQPL